MNTVIDRRTFVRTSAIAGLNLAFLPSLSRISAAAMEGDTLRVLSDETPNTFDPAGLGYNRTAMKISLCLYDRLFNFGQKTLENGSAINDYTDLKPELAESWTEAPDGRSITIKIRSDAIFHDGTPVTAADVKWSLDRAVSVPVAKGQMKTGSMTDPEQFVIVDDHTIRIDLPNSDRRALPNLVFPFFPIFNSTLTKQHASDVDTWATQWLQVNPAGGGAYRLESWAPGQNIILQRFDEWKSGSLPYFSRIVEQVVPESSNRRIALENGDSDLALDLPPRDVRDLEKGGKVKVISTPRTNNLTFVAMNTKMAPFDKTEVRQAIAYALPYDSLFKSAQQERGTPLYGGDSDLTTRRPEFPTQSPYSTDPERAKALLAEAGYPNGFETTFSFDINNSDVGEPAAILIQEALAKIGVMVTIDKLPSGQFGSALQSHQIPFFIENSVSWIADPDYYFNMSYNTDWRFNFGNFQDHEMQQLLADSRWEMDSNKYDAAVRRMVEIAFDKIPIIPLWLSSYDVAMKKDVEGFVYYYHRRVDYRLLKRA